MMGMRRPQMGQRPPMPGQQFGGPQFTPAQAPPGGFGGAGPRMANPVGPPGYAQNPMGGPSPIGPNFGAFGGGPSPVGPNPFSKGFAGAPGFNPFQGGMGPGSNMAPLLKGMMGGMQGQMPPWMRAQQMMGGMGRFL